MDINVPAYVLDREGTICWLNDAASELVGDVVGLPLTAVVALDHREARRIFERNLAGYPSPDRTIDVTDPHGRATRVEVSSVRLGPAHHAVGMFGLAVPESKEKTVPRADSPLTPRQHEVLHLLAQGVGTTTIAERLYLSPETVRNHVREILRRLGTNSRLAAVAAARREGLV
jgi:DNA-binding NarL/FixJ family response regulator